MAKKTVSPYGSWDSPITTDLITRGAVALGQIAIDDGEVFWAEMRPSEAGRSAICRISETGDSPLETLTPPPYNVRSRAHEYGGGAFTVAGGTIYFVDAAKQVVYQQTPGGKPRAVTKESKLAYADFVFDSTRNRLVCVAEDAGAAGEPANSLIAINLTDGEILTLAAGADFYTAPKLSPDGTRLAWVEWRHPNMPWDGTLLKEAVIAADGTLGTPATLAGGEEISIFQPEYAPDGTLYYVSDESGFWNICRAGDTPAHYAFDADFGLPHWVFGMRTYGFLDAGRILCTYARKGDWSLGVLDLATSELKELDLPWCGFDGLVCADGKAAFLGGLTDGPDEIVELHVDSGEVRILRRSTDIDIPPDCVSIAETVEFPTENGLTAFGYFYPPSNGSFEGAEGELPPLIVKGHGGPTGQTTKSFALKIQFWTSRGFAVLDVNYGGSTGFGRAYRERLTGQWGIVDVDDCANGAKHLVKQGRVDPDRLIIVGGSAGGYTTLCALTFRDVFKAGCSSYGIGDLTALAEDTHKFESRYLDKMVGPWPETAALYRERSPIHHPGSLNCPVIFLQGDEDKVVPPNQAEMMVDVLRQKQLPVAYLLFEGEGHGFRRADTIRRALEAELSFYGQMFGFSPAGDIEPVEIENL